MSAWAEISGMITVKQSDHFSIKKFFDDILNHTDYFVTVNQVGNSDIYDVTVTYEEEGKVADKLKEEIIGKLSENKIKYDLYFNIRHAS